MEANVAIWNYFFGVTSLHTMMGMVIEMLKFLYEKFFNQGRREGKFFVSSLIQCWMSTCLTS
jgi:hypothetical protein